MSSFISALPLLLLLVSIPRPEKPIPGGRLSLALAFLAKALARFADELLDWSAVRFMAVLWMRLRCRTMVGLPSRDVGMLDEAEVEVEVEEDVNVDAEESCEASFPSVPFVRAALSSPCPWKGRCFSDVPD